MVAGDHVHRQRKPPEHLAQHGVLVGTTVVGQVAGDDHAVGPGVQREHPAERPVQAGSRLGAEDAGGQVRIAEVGDEHRASTRPETPTLSPPRPARGPTGSIHTLWIAHVYDRSRLASLREYA
ncbi:hypothetical protein GCM10029963_50950 [Micromonospora andamanensis]